MVKLVCFKTTDRLGPTDVVDPKSIRHSKKPIEGYYSVDPSDYPGVFEPEYEDKEQKTYRTDEDGHIVYRPLWSEGWENFPLYTYTPENGFQPFDPYSCVGLKRWYRRQRMIRPELLVKTKKETELKLHRKAIEAIVRRFPELEEEPEVRELLSLSQHIRDVIAKYPKEEMDKQIDLHEVNAPTKGTGI
jgi:hypothetical protein